MTRPGYGPRIRLQIENPCPKLGLRQFFVIVRKKVDGFVTAKKEVDWFFVT